MFMCMGWGGAAAHLRRPISSQICSCHCPLEGQQLTWGDQFVSLYMLMYVLIHVSLYVYITLIIM